MRDIVVSTADEGDEMSENTKTCQYSHHEFSAEHASYTTELGTVCSEHFEAAVELTQE